MRSKTCLSCVGLMLIMLCVDGCATRTAKVAALLSAKVGIDNFTFAPATLTVPAGTTVTWTNHDDIPHTATSDNKVFSSDALDTDQSYSFQFNTPGTYPYHCAVHPHMTGTVIVK